MFEDIQAPEISFLGFTVRMTIMHIVTYFLFGFIFAFYNPFHQGVHTIELYPEYQVFFKTMDSIYVIGGGLFQIFRAPIIAASLYPFKDVFLGKKNGWLYLCGVMVALTLIGSVVPGPGSIEGLLYTNLPLALHLDGYPEVITQMIGFSYLVYYWEHNQSKKLTYAIVAVFLAIVFMLSMGVYVNL